jgi:homogentisate 1,2-dioxygenase
MRPRTEGPVAELQYLTGFGNEFATESVPGVLPQGQSAPQKVALGLYAELWTGTPFTAPRATNRRTWVYRINPSAKHKPFRELPTRLLRSGPFDEVPTPPTQLRWDPFPLPESPTDFIDGLITLGGNGDPSQQSGIALHMYAANASMTDRFFYDADGELLIVPQLGSIRVFTELGMLDVAPGEICVIPRGLRFRVDVKDEAVRGLVAENYGPAFRLPELGPIGSNGLANPRDFQSPVAAFEDREGTFRQDAKFLGRLWTAEIDHSPLDVVAWHGNYAPYKYDLANFVALSTVTFDPPDPSIYTVLTAPTAIPGTANADFIVFPPRWIVAEHTFRPPAFHRNVSSEFLTLIKGVYHGKTGGFAPGGASLHNCMTGHGPDAVSYEKAVAAEEKPEYLANTLAVMLETQLVIRPTRFALESQILQSNYFEAWQGLKKNFTQEPLATGGR